jgi:hypothetical protein
MAIRTVQATIRTVQAKAVPGMCPVKGPADSGISGSDSEEIITDLYSQVTYMVICNLSIWIYGSNTTFSVIL